METLDVRGISDEHVRWLRQVVERLRVRAGSRKDRRRHIVFATHKSHLIDGYRRSAAYDDS